MPTPTFLYLNFQFQSFIIFKIKFHHIEIEYLRTILNQTTSFLSKIIFYLCFFKQFIFLIHVV